jgi:hypothetical protein
MMLTTLGQTNRQSLQHDSRPRNDWLRSRTHEYLLNMVMFTCYKINHVIYSLASKYIIRLFSYSLTLMRRYCDNSLSY